MPDTPPDNSGQPVPVTVTPPPTPDAATPTPPPPTPQQMPSSASGAPDMKEILGGKKEGQPSAEDMAKLPAPSATVEAFSSGGGPPAPEAKPRKFPLAAILTILVMLGTFGGAGYYYWAQGGKIPGIAPAATPTPAPVSTTSEYDTDLKSIDDSMADVSTNLTDTDSVLADKQGDLSE